MRSTDAERWQEVSPAEPCPICEKGGWCRRSPDGKWVLCRREHKGAQEVTTYADGSKAYRHLLRDDPPTSNGRQHRAGTVGPGTPAADSDTRDRAYRMLLDELRLSAEHRQALRARGLNDEDIDAGGYRTWPAGAMPTVIAAKLWQALGRDTFERIPGFGPGVRIHAGPGLLVPVRDSVGRIVALKLRRDNPGSGPRFLYVTSRSKQQPDGPSPGSPAHVPAGTPRTCSAVRITEGELKADIAWRISELPTVSFPGVSSWRAVLPVLQALEARSVRVAFDADASSNANVARALRDSVKELAAHGYAVELERWPTAAGKGIDDLLASGGTPEVLRGPAALQAAQDIAQAAGVEDTASSEDWPGILSLDALDLPDFPTHALPEVLQRWAEAESHATQTPKDLAALLAMAVCAACLARRVLIEPRPGWREPGNLFVAVLLEPGNRKSAVFADAVRPLRDRENELIEDARPIVARAQSERRQAESRLRKLEKLAAEKGDMQAAAEAGNLAAELAEQTEPVLPTLIVDDATAEKLGMMLAEQGGRIASMSPEGGVFDLMAGLYSKSGIPQFGVYLMGHSGDDLVTDRVSRKRVRVERPALTCAFAIQPAVIEGLAGNAAFRGRGLLARFLYAAPRSWIGRREIAPAPVSNATQEAYRQTVQALAELRDETVLLLAADAKALLREWETEIEEMLGDGGQMEAMRDWGAKLAGATLRLAAVLHCVEHGPAGPIEAQTIRAAIEIARYLIPHADAVLSMMAVSDKSADDDARYVLRWITRHGRREFSKTEAQHAGKRRFPKADDIDPALAELTRRGYIRPRPAATTGPGRPPSPAYEVNPAVFDAALPEKRPHNSRNSAEPPVNGNSGNIGSAFEQEKEWGEV